MAVTPADATSPTAEEAVFRASEPPRLHPIRRLRELLRSHELIGNLVRKEVKVKYASSLLGAAWSTLNPVLYLAVFSIVFRFVLPTNVPNYPVYLLSGLLPWNLFATSLSLAMRSVVDNANLVTKVYFPREILPLASIGAAGVDFLLQALVLLGFMAAVRYDFVGANLLLLPLSVVALLALTTALALWVASLNVRYRDTQHLVALGLTLWLWLTPVIYPSGFVYERLGGSEARLLGVPVWHLFLANPMAPIVMGFQRALYAEVRPVLDNGESMLALPPVSIEWLAAMIGGVALGALVLGLLTWRGFFHRSGDFAEEL